MKRRNKRKSVRPKTKLGLPDLEHAKAAVVGSLPSPGSKREYGRSIDEFVARYCSEQRLSFNKTVVMRFRMHLENAIWLQPPSTYIWRPFGDSHMRRQIRAY